MEEVTEAIFTGRGIVKHYPGTVALDGVELDIHPGEVIALLGENGAGKSTFAKIIAGVEQPTAGEMTWLGKPYAPASPRDAIDVGVGMIHQEMQLLPDLSVGENVFVGRWLKDKAGNVDRKEMDRRAEEQLRQLGFTLPMSTLVRDLSVAGQQQVEIARALLLDTKVLILDEPTAALGQEETEALFQCVRDLQKEGVAFIYVSHRLAEIAQIATRIVVLRDGQQVATHDTSDVHPDDLVAEMVGRRVERLFPDFAEPRDEVVLEVENLNAAGGKVTDISFQVRAGEVFGIAGIVGAGRTELVRAIAGADRSSTGTIKVHGETLPRHSVGGAVEKGLVMIPEDRKRQGIILGMTIEENTAIPNMDLASGKTGWITKGRMRALAESIIESMGVKGQSFRAVRTLSGGNQQKVVIGKWITRNPRVVILDEPTRGIDVGARAAIYDVIAGLVADGVAVVVVSSDLEEVIGLSHRLMVLSRGRDMGTLEQSEATGERIIALATK